MTRYHSSNEGHYPYYGRYPRHGYRYGPPYESYGNYYGESEAYCDRGYYGRGNPPFRDRYEDEMPEIPFVIRFTRPKDKTPTKVVIDTIERWIAMQQVNLSGDLSKGSRIFLRKRPKSGIKKASHQNHYIFSGVTCLSKRDIEGLARYIRNELQVPRVDCEYGCERISFKHRDDS